jgi:hypothetical protein
MSSGDTKILVFLEFGAWYIIDLNGNTVVPFGSMPANNSGLLVWDWTDDKTFWGTIGNSLQKCTIALSTVSCVVSHTFSEYGGYKVNLPDKSDMTSNGWLAMVGQNVPGGNVDVFLFNPTTQTKSPVFTISPGCDVNVNTMSCMHGFLTTPHDGVAVDLSGGSFLWESPWTTPLPQIQSATSHNDFGLDLNGTEVGVFSDFNDYTGVAYCSGAPFRGSVVQFPMSSWPNLLEPLCIVNEPTDVPWEISFRDWKSSPWVAFSAMNTSAAEYFNSDASYQSPSSSNWNVYSGEIVLARIDANNDPTKIYRLTLSHSRQQQGFWALPRATISRDGKYVIFDSNAAWGRTGCGSITDCTDIYLIGPLL